MLFSRDFWQIWANCIDTSSADSVPIFTSNLVINMTATGLEFIGAGQSAVIGSNAKLNRVVQNLLTDFECVYTD